jgi:ABC-type branched-subunit amino acid transport system substrate-binding protein
MVLKRRECQHDAGDSKPCFDGAEQLFSLIHQLYQRPRVGDRPRELRAAPMEWAGYWGRQERSGRRGLPMVCLVRSQSHKGVLTVIEQRLAEGVRHAYLQGTGAETIGPGVEAVRDILTEARNEFIGSTKAHGRGLRFELFSLVVWLMNVKVDDNDLNPDRTLLTQVRKRSIATWFSATIQKFDNELPDNWWWRALSFVLRGVAALLFQVVVSGRVPILSGQYRWFLRQPHLAPELSGSFPRFARRLTVGERGKEAPEYLKRLLVNAFLEDLRRAYRLRPWHVLSKRRMTYPVLLLDDITAANGGYELLRLINEVRNQVGLFDPLLVISASSEVPPAAGWADLDRRKYDAKAAGQAYLAWQKALPKDRLARGNPPEDRLARGDTAWYLPIRIPDGESREAEEWWQAFSGYRLEHWRAKPPWWTTRRVRVLAPVVVAAIVAGAVVKDHQDGVDSHCGTEIASLIWTGTECVGMSDGSHHMFQPSDEATRQVEDKIYAQNQRAEELHRAHPERPYITLVALQALTSSSGTADGLTTQRESLGGFAVAQARQLTDSTASEPIVRILIGNAGKGMQEGVRVAGQLRELAEQNRSIVGVVGLDMSSDATQATIAALTNAGLPMVASTLSADRLADLNPMYFQVAPQNRREAEVVGAFVDQLAARPRSVRVYYSDDESDNYSTNLRDDALKSFQVRNLRVEARAFIPNTTGGARSAHERYGDQLIGNAAAAGRDICSFDGYVFFAGRGVPDFSDFVGGAAQCGSKAVLIGDDDVSRHVADGVARQQNRALPYYYVSFATAPVTQPEGLARDFYTTLEQLFPLELTAQGRSLDGHAALAFDAAQVMITATAYLRETAATIPVTPGSVWRMITAIHTSQPDARQVNKNIDGVTGTIDYGGDISRHVPENKPVAILRVNVGEVDTKVLAFCGQAAGLSSAPWCPASG